MSLKLGGSPAWREESMGLEIGMVGLPNVGKSSLFSGLAREDAEVASRLLTTTDPHVDVFFVRA